ncbi:MAG: DUF4037 domain-containing protein [Synergistes sp.]|nr:DUF4037 domain-containing protein [Synergistes sp.]
MQGLELCRRYYEEIAAPLIEEKFGGCASRFAAGLAGEGSECLGFDDEISRDHDFGPGFCLWLTDEDFEKYGAELKKLYDSLPKEFMCITRNTQPQASHRTGVIRISDFYRRYTGCSTVPPDEASWFRIPSHLLAAATAGAVFRDDLGEFSGIRKALLPCYPRDVRLKKLAARVFVMAQAGQYNYPRCVKRGDMSAAAFALSRFAEAALEAFHLINERYAPYYKWLFRSAERLPVLREAVSAVGGMYSERGGETEKIEYICELTAAELQRSGLSGSHESFLTCHAEEIMLRINSAYLKKFGVMTG